MPENYHKLDYSQKEITLKRRVKTAAIFAAIFLIIAAAIVCFWYFTFYSPEITVSFSIDGAVEETVSLRKNKIFPEKSIPEDPGKDGYDFTGWLDTDNNIFDFSKKIKKSITLHAGWDFENYTILYNTNGGTWNSSQPVLSYNISQNITLPAASQIIRTGHTFLGWFIDASFETGEQTQITSGSMGSREYFAKWRKNTVTVAFSMGEGTGTAPSAENYEWNDIIVLETPADASRKGYKFSCWSVNGSYAETDTYYIQNLFSELDNRDIIITQTINAVWEVCFLTIVYNKNHTGASGTMTNSDEIEFTDSAAIKENAFISPDLSEFYEWNTASNGSGTAIAGTAAAEILWDLAQADENGNKILTLYAIWDTALMLSGTAVNGMVTGLKNDSAVPVNLVIPASVFDRTSGITYTVKSIAAEAFKNKASIESIILPTTVTSIGAHAFAGCTGLAEITMPIVSSFFYGFFGALVSSMPASLKTVILSTSVNIPNSYFQGCNYLENVILPNNVQNIGDLVFYMCSSLTTFGTVLNNSVYAVSPDGKLIIKKADGQIISAAHNNILDYEINEQIENVTVLSLNAYLFAFCSSIKTLQLPDTITSIGSNAFLNCTGLQSVILSSALITLGSSAFEGCSTLQSIIFSKNIESIGASCFNNCSLLISVTINRTLSDGSLPSLGVLALDNTDASLEIFVPQDSIAEYKTAPNWNNYGDKIFSI